MGERLYETHDGKGLRGLPLFTTCGKHCRPGDALKYCVRDAFAQRSNEPRAQQVAGGFAGNQADLHQRSLADQAALGGAKRFKEQV